MSNPCQIFDINSTIQPRLAFFDSFHRRACPHESPHTTYVKANSRLSRNQINTFNRSSAEILIGIPVNSVGTKSLTGAFIAT